MKLEKLLLYILILVLPLGQFSKIPLGLVNLPDITVYYNDLLIPFLIFIWLTRQLAIRKKLDLPPFSGLILLFTAISFLSLLNSFRWLGIAEFIVSGLYWWRWVQYAFLYPIVFSVVKEGNETKLSAGETALDKNEARIMSNELRITNYALRISSYLLLSITIFSLLGLVQFLLFPDFSKYIQHGWDPHYYRLLSTFFDPNFAGIFLILGFVLAVSLLLTRNSNKLRRHAASRGSHGTFDVLVSPVWEKLACTDRLQSVTQEDNTLKRVSTVSMVKGHHVKSAAGGLTWQDGQWLLVSCLLSAVCCLLTFSRSTYLAFAVAVISLGILKSRKLLVVFFVLAVLAFLFVPRVRTRVVGALELDITARARVEDWLKTGEIVKDNWLTGVGFNSFRYAQEHYGYFRNAKGLSEVSGHAGAGADSSLLFVWATTGIFGLISYLLLYSSIWLESVLRLRKLKVKSMPRSEAFRGEKLVSPLGGLKVKIKNSKSISLSQALLLTIVVSIPTLFVHSLFVNSLFYPWVMEWMWIVLGITYGLDSSFS
ncbi:O-antigen ligase family protein [Patescibacteria group bacterium]|nr:O-antigen ligase family protein [Patescibacteria group bacterium]